MTLELHDDALYGGDAAARADPGDMLRAIASSGAQVRSAAAASAEAGLAVLADEGRPRAVVVLGTGSSAVAGDLLAALTGPACPVPVLVHRGRDLPAWVGAADLVVALSGSGRTEETVTALEGAARRGSRLLVVGAEGSPLHERARQARGLFVPVPPGRPSRADLWALATPLVVAASHLGLLGPGAPPLPDMLEATAGRLESVAERCRSTSDAPVNAAKVLATQLGGSLPLVWGTTALTGVAASRFADQIAENAKAPALHGLLAEVAHHQLAVLDGPYGRASGGDGDDFFRDRVDDPEPPLRLRLVLLRDAPRAEHPRDAARAAALRDVAATRNVSVSEVVTEGDSGYERLAELVGLTDYASAYLALLHGVDPTAVAVIDELDRRTAR